MDRREFVKKLAIGTGCLVLLPTVTACASQKGAATDPAPPNTDPATTPTAPDPNAVPLTKPADWEPISYNRERGLAGAIPESYHASITAEDGPAQHLGKHLPYMPTIPPEMSLPAGYIALMWGDPDKGYAPHPNAEPNESNNHEGHWYNWIRLRKATPGEAEELQSAYDGWPAVTENANGAYAVMGGGDITENAGKNTIYLAALPADARPGDTLRIHAHCLTHGEYVDFITI